MMWRRHPACDDHYLLCKDLLVDKLEALEAYPTGIDKLEAYPTDIDKLEACPTFVGKGDVLGAKHLDWCRSDLMAGGFGLWIEKFPWASADNFWSDVIERIWIVHCGACLLTIRRPLPPRKAPARATGAAGAADKHRAA